MESGLRVVDAPHYLLYKQPEQFLRTKLLPINVKCKHCQTDQVIDLVPDVHWSELMYDKVRYEQAVKRVQEERNRSFMTFKENLDLSYPWPKKTSFGGPTFYSKCAICDHHVTYSFDVHDDEPIRKFIQGRDNEDNKKGAFSRVKADFLYWVLFVSFVCVTYGLYVYVINSG